MIALSAQNEDADASYVVCIYRLDNGSLASADGGFEEAPGGGSPDEGAFGARVR